MARVIAMSALEQLVHQRRALMTDLGDAMRLAGGSNPKRKQINRNKRRRQRELRLALKGNTDAIISRCLELYS